MTPLARAKSSASLIAELDAAGIAGRGGAAFPTARKLQALTKRKTALIVNACDGELGAVKDGWVTEHHLDELRQGAELLAKLTRGPVLYAAHRDSVTHRRLAAAGLDVLDTPDRYVSSEETSLINLSQGGLARPMTKRSLYLQGGRDSAGRAISPTLVLNAETVWRVAQIAEHGAAWFRSLGTADEPGPRLVSVGGYVAGPVVIETQAGVPGRDLLAAAGTPDDAAYVLVNGLGGAVIRRADFERAPFSRQGLAPFGGRVGPGIIEVLDPRVCPLQVVTELLEYAAGESAGQCGPCMFGIPELLPLWQRFVARQLPADRQALERALGLLPDRGGCRFPDGVAMMTKTALSALEPELSLHRSAGCSAPRPRRSL